MKTESGGIFLSKLVAGDSRLVVIVVDRRV